MNGLRRSSVKTIKKSLLLSVVCLSAIPIVLGSYLSLNNAASVRKQTIHNNEVLLYQVRDLIDAGFFDTFAISQKIAGDYRLGELNRSIKYAPDSIKKNAFIQELKKQVNSSSYVKDIYVYYRDTDQFISSSTIASSRIMYTAYYKNAATDYPSWLSAFQNTTAEGTAMLMPTVLPNNVYTIAFIQTLPNHIYTDTNATIMIIMDIKAATNLTNNIYESSGCTFDIMLHSAQSTLFSDSYVPSSMQKIMEESEGTDEMFHITQEDGTVVSAVNSEVYDVSFLLTTPTGVFTRLLHQSNILFLITLIIIVLGSISVSIWLIYRNYIPIKEIIGIIYATKSQSKYNSELDEYANIKSAVLNAKTENEVFSSKLQILSEKLEMTSLSLMLRNSFTESPDNQEGLEQLALYFSHEHFMVILFLLPNNWGEDMQNFSLVKSGYLIEALERLCGPMIYNEDMPFVYRIVQQSNNLVVVFNFDDEHDFSGDLDAMISELCENWEQVFAEKLLCAKSGIHDGLTTISSAYYEAEYAMKYHSIFGCEPSVEWQGSAKVRNYFYPPEEDSKLYNAMVSGNLPESVAVFDNIWQINTIRNNMPKEYIYCLLYDIAGTVIRALNIVGTPSISVSEFNADIRKLVLKDDIRDIYLELNALITSVCKCYAKEHESSNQKLKQAIINYIETNYNNPNLSVESIGDVFSKSRSFLFSLFKEETGSGLLYHINKVRIDRAKHLLRKNDLAIQEIATFVGFNTALSFSRTFKNIEKTTPGNYRKRLLQCEISNFV